MRTRALTLLFCLAAISAQAYPPAPYYRIYGSVRDDHGNPLSTGTGTMILSGIYSGLGTATASGGAITGVTILNAGSGYTSVPTVKFVRASGTGTEAVGTAILTNGVVTGVTVTNPGSGYTGPVTVGIFGGGAPPLEIVRGPTDSSIAPGINYSLSVPMDSGTTAQLYEITVMRPLLPFTIKVVIDGVNYVPIQIAGATSAFWTTKINSVNSPGIQSQGGYWAIGQPSGKLRLDLWLGIDSDNDGLPDEWEQDVIASDPTGRLTGLGDVTPGGDLSGNGMTNLDKFLTGVYALEPLDGLNFRVISVTAGIAKLRFQAITGRTYHIAGSSDLVTWTNPLPFSIATDASNLKSYSLATESLVQNFYVPVGTVRLKFFRLYAE